MKILGTRVLTVAIIAPAKRPMKKPVVSVIPLYRGPLARLAWSSGSVVDASCRRAAGTVIANMRRNPTDTARWHA